MKRDGLADTARYMLEEAIMEYVPVQKSNTVTSAESTVRASERVALSLRNWQGRIEKESKNTRGRISANWKENIGASGAVKR